MGTDLVIYALDQLGIKVTPFVAYLILGAGVLSLLAAGVGGAITIYRVVWRRKSKATGFPVPLPIRWWIRLKSLTRRSSGDAIVGGGEEGDYDLWLDVRFQVNRPAKVDLVTMNILGEALQGELVGVSLLLQNQNMPLYFRIPNQLCLGELDITPVSSVGGQEIPAANSVRIRFDE